MLRNVMTAALVLALGLTAAGCANSTAGTSARNWREDTINDTTNNATARGWTQDSANRRTFDTQNEARGPLNDGAYAANQDGKVRGYDARTNDTAARKNAATRAGEVGRDIANGAKDAARSIGDAAEDALDNMKDAAKDTAEDTRDGVNPNGQGTGLNQQ